MNEKCKISNCYANHNGECQFKTDIGQIPNNRKCPHYEFDIWTFIMNNPNAVAILTSAVTAILANIIFGLVR